MLRILRLFDPFDKNAGNLSYLGITLTADVVFDVGKQSTVELQVLETSPYVAHLVEFRPDGNSRFRHYRSARITREIVRTVIQRDIYDFAIFDNKSSLRDAFVIIMIVGYVRELCAALHHHLGCVRKFYSWGKVAFNSTNQEHKEQRFLCPDSSIQC